MRVCQLKLSGFRNYRELDLIPGTGLNILFGANAQGKSNILEAISLLATTRSLRAGKESEMIARDAEMAHIQAEIEREREGDADLQVSVFQNDKKTVRVNGLKRPRVIDLLGQFNAVFFGALDLAIVTGEPSDRRHYLNIEISQISPRYVYDLGHYKRVLAQRNRLLRELRERPRPPQDVGLDIWNEQLVAYGAPIFDRRRFYVERLAPLADQIHRELTDNREGLEVRYAPSIPLPPVVASAPTINPNGGQAVNPNETSSAMLRETNAEERYLKEIDQATREKMRENREVNTEENTKENTDAELGPAPCPDQSAKGPESALSATETLARAFREHITAIAPEEMRRGGTLAGPQRDDLSFRIDGLDARIYGSQGQQRTVALALKLAEFRLIEDYVGETPVMLLDDVMSDLDDSRRQHLLNWVRGRCQTFLTCTNLRYFSEEILAEATRFHVVAGTVTPDGAQKS